MRSNVDNDISNIMSKFKFGLDNKIFDVWCKKFRPYDRTLIDLEIFVEAMLKEEFNEVSAKLISQ